MDQRIKNLLPELTYDYEGYEVFSDNITYIFEVPHEHYKITYELDEFINDLDIEVFYKCKLRECHVNNSVHIASGCNSTGAPRGLVVNVNQLNAIKLEKELIVFSLLKDTKWTVSKLDNIQNKIDAGVKQDKLFNSLFTIE